MFPSVMAIFSIFNNIGCIILAYKLPKMQKIENLFLIIGQGYIYLKKRPRPLKFEDICSYLLPLVYVQPK